MNDTSSNQSRGPRTAVRAKGRVATGRTPRTSPTQVCCNSAVAVDTSRKIAESGCSNNKYGRRGLPPNVIKCIQAVSPTSRQNRRKRAVQRLTRCAILERCDAEADPPGALRRPSSIVSEFAAWGRSVDPLATTSSCVGHILYVGLAAGDRTTDEELPL